jgi:site-specific DNA recombinase
MRCYARPKNAVSQIVTRKRRLSSGKIIGGIPFTKGRRTECILERSIMASRAIQASIPQLLIGTSSRRFKAASRRRSTAMGYKRSRSGALRIGKLFDDRGHRMTPSFAVKRGVRYRYYVSRATTEGRRGEAGTIARVPAPMSSEPFSALW